MTIRKKIFLLAGILLALFGVVVGLLAVFQKRNADQIANIVEYQLPVSRYIGEIDVDTYGYELIVQRLLLTDAATPAQIQEAQTAEGEVAGRLRRDVAAADALLNEAIANPRYGAAERIALARTEGSYKYLARSIEPFLGVGHQAIAALAVGDRDAARAAALGFKQYEQAYGPDIATIRGNIADLNVDATQAILDSQRADTELSFALFLLASGVGLGISAVGSTHVVGGLRQLAASTRALESGATVTPLLVRTRDEVGELATLFNRMIEELRARERIKDTFGKFVDPRIVSRLIDSGADQAERRTLTVFFSDIKQFTNISEQLTASAIVNLLNNYFGIVADVIHDHHGVIDKYIGDAVMAFWTPPFTAGEGHAAAACLAALDQQEALVALRAQLPEITGMRRNPPPFFVRMGIATGEGVIGTIGSASTRSYTVIGDTVNLASRLEGVNKLYGTSIILNEEAYRLAQQVIEARELDTITVSGKTEPVRIYEAVARVGQLGAERTELHGIYADGLSAYRRRAWDEAQERFEACLRIAADDGPSRVFLSRIAQIRTVELPADWDGVWRLTEK
jgi:adenylate cyclase